MSKRLKTVSGLRRKGVAVPSIQWDKNSDNSAQRNEEYEKRDGT